MLLAEHVVEIEELGETWCGQGEDDEEEVKGIHFGYLFLAFLEDG